MLRTRWSPSPGQVALAFVIFLVGAYLVRAATHTFYWQPDDELFRTTATYVVDRFPGSLFTLDEYQRGLQRLHVWLLAFSFGVSKGSTAFFLMHLIQVAGYVSAAIPAYLIARGLGVSQALGVLAGTLTILTPWAIVSVSLLTEPVAYGLFAWLVWATWRATTTPSTRAELLALGLLALALLTRTGFLPLVLLFPIAALAQTARFDRLRNVRRRHPILVPVTAIGAVLSLLVLTGAIPVTNVTGLYATGFQPPLSQVLSKDHTYVSRLILATAFLPAALALAWWVRQLARPQSPKAHAWAVIAVSAFLLILFANYNSPGDERYVMYLVPLVAVSGIVALGTRSLPVWGVVAGAVVVILGAFTAQWYLSNSGAGALFGLPMEYFRERVLNEGLGVRAHGLSPSVVLLLGAAVATALAAVAVRGGRWRTPALAAIGVGLVGFQLVSTGYTFGKYVEGPGLGNGPSLSQRTWVDDSVPRNTHVVALALTDANSVEFQDTWHEIEFFNQTIDHVATNEQGSTPYPRFSTGIHFTIDPDTGLSDQKLPRYGVAPTAPYTNVHFAGKTLATSTYQPLAVQTITQPARAQWTVGDASFFGAVLVGRPVRIQVYRPHAPAHACGKVKIGMPPDYPHKRGLRWRIDDGLKTIGAGRLRPGESVSVQATLHSNPDSDLRFLPISIEASDGPVEGPPLKPSSVTLQAFELTSCRGARSHR